ncbi:hypothetical protein AC578_9567 [Pseudocercospora eumusae]|uniref:Uncharacterized protein n=1 Tax=Pseudocercospora eumusae TaxID=321146 RepID=A0A139HG99_9PEZI|nr:hypothetical protein AC578_9567 [Pseudocercospora eumusae]
MSGNDPAGNGIDSGAGFERHHRRDRHFDVARAAQGYAPPKRPITGHRPPRNARPPQTPRTMATDLAQTDRLLWVRCPNGRYQRVEVPPSRTHAKRPARVYYWQLVDATDTTDHIDIELGDGTAGGRTTTENRPPPLESSYNCPWAEFLRLHPIIPLKPKSKLRTTYDYYMDKYARLVCAWVTGVVLVCGLAAMVALYMLGKF